MPSPEQPHERPQETPPVDGASENLEAPETVEPSTSESSAVDATDSHDALAASTPSASDEQSETTDSISEADGVSGVSGASGADEEASDTEDAETATEVPVVNKDFLLQGWAGERWVRPMEESVDPVVLAEGADLARKKRVADIDIAPGKVLAIVREIGGRRRKIGLAIDTFEASVWETALEELDKRPAAAAKLLAGELPADIEDVFAPAGVRLFPAQPQDIRPVSARTMARGDGIPEDWSSSACAASYAAAARLNTSPVLIFTLRGMSAERFVEAMRQRRAVQRSLHGVALAYAQRPVPGGEEPATPLEQCIGNFWQAGPTLNELDVSLAPPKVRLAILRRLGPSPFKEARFPMAGLLATCYDILAEAALQEPAAEDETT